MPRAAQTVSKPCQHCGKTFVKKPYYSVNKFAEFKFCSTFCANQVARARRSTDEWKLRKNRARKPAPHPDLQRVPPPPRPADFDAEKANPWYDPETMGELVTDCRAVGLSPNRLTA